jgi:hypothetical protein
MMAFTIVHFVETNTVEAVPLSWIISEGDDLICLWPTKGANRHIREQTPPDVSWQSFNIRRLGSKGWLFKQIQLMNGL